MDNVGISSVVMMFLLPLLAVLVLNASAEKLRQEQPFLALPRKLGGSEEMTMEWHPISASVPNICRKDNGKGVNFPDARVPWQLETHPGMTIVACWVPQVTVAEKREAATFIMKENGDMHSENDSAIQFKLCEHLPLYFYGTEEWLEDAKLSKGWYVTVGEEQTSLFRKIFFISEDKLLLENTTSNSGLLIIPDQLSLPTLLGTDKLDKIVQFRFDWVDPQKAQLELDLTQWKTMGLRVVKKTETTTTSSKVFDNFSKTGKVEFSGFKVTFVLRPDDVKIESGGARISICGSMEDGRTLFLESDVSQEYQINLSEESLNDGTTIVEMSMQIALDIGFVGFLKELVPTISLMQNKQKGSKTVVAWATKVIARTSVP
eukprot:GHVS01050194.1.p1 GENE.GHVS01050194.1~~GHVS01050194.1.p1  ORF type:complete len:375 (-),score=36.03 GHVS01050194.1:192-1316(-)